MSSNPRKSWRWKTKRVSMAFSPRQHQLMDAIMDGATTYSDMADALCLSQRTIQTMLLSMYRKTGARNMADLILWRIKQDA